MPFGGPSDPASTPINHFEDVAVISEAKAFANRWTVRNTCKQTLVPGDGIEPSRQTEASIKGRLDDSLLFEHVRKSPVRHYVHQPHRITGSYRPTTGPYRSNP